MRKDTKKSNRDNEQFKTALAGEYNEWIKNLQLGRQKKKKNDYFS